MSDLRREELEFLVFCIENNFAFMKPHEYRLY